MAVLFQRQGTGSSATAIGRGDRTQSAVPPPGLIEKIIEQRLVTAEFQPIVRLSSGEVVGFETLARGPADSALSSPAAMFRAAAAIGAAGQLDQVAHVAAYRALIHTPPAAGLTFFVNFHPATRSTRPPDDLAELLDRATRELRIVAELAEQELVADPVRAVVVAQEVRKLGLHIALDNLGSLEALPLLSLLQPDVIKLDPSLLAGPNRQKSARIVDALVNYTDDTSALVVGQGIERPDQLPIVLGTGSTLGQGYLFGPPVTVPVVSNSVRQPVELVSRYQQADATVTPYDMLLDKRTPTIVEGGFLQALGAHLEERADNGGEPFVMFVVSPSGKPLSGLSPTRLRGLGRKASLLVTLSSSRDLTSGREILAGELGRGDPLRDDQVLAFVTPTSGSLLTARPADHPAGSFQCMLTHDRHRAVEACRSLLAKYLSVTEDNR